MLLVEAEPVSLAMLSSNLKEEQAFSFEPDLGLLALLDREFLASEETVILSVDDESESKHVLESFKPVRRNLLCFWVCSLALWIERSHSLQRIALSSWQNRHALLSWNKNIVILAVHIQLIMKAWSILKASRCQNRLWGNRSLSNHLVECLFLWWNAFLLVRSYIS